MPVGCPCTCQSGYHLTLVSRPHSFAIYHSCYYYYVFDHSDLLDLMDICVLFIGDASLQAATGSSALFVPKLRLLHSFSFHSFNITTFLDHFNTNWSAWLGLLHSLTSIVLTMSVLSQTNPYSVLGHYLNSQSSASGHLQPSVLRSSVLHIWPLSEFPIFCIRPSSTFCSSIIRIPY